jgi:predicted nucleic acid-binding protein
VVADAGPLIVLARAGRLTLLRALYRRLAIPRAVHRELGLVDARPGARALTEALAAGWLVVARVERLGRVADYARRLDAGEAEAIALAEEREARLLLVDDALARRTAEARGLRVARTADVLLAAKREGLVGALAPCIAALARHDYRLAEADRAALLAAAGEG